MNSQFIVDRSGQKFALYAGLVHEAHSLGLVSILTDLIQIPGDGNGKTAIVKATVTMVRDGVAQTFQGYGDASPANVKAHMVNCIIRLAETRAKARALRDAVDVGMCCLEELSDFDESDEDVVMPAGTGQRSPAAPAPDAGLRIVNGKGRKSNRMPNDSGAQCTCCFAPAGALHLANCKGVLEQSA